MSLGGLVMLVQIVFAVVVGLYFWNLLKSQQGARVTVQKESRKEMEKLQRLREISLSEPLTERTRPASLTEIIGQEQGVKALRAGLCGPNPQHVIVYGPPGVGKTAAARLVLEEAKRNPLSPFREDAQFVELDATTARFDERGIADPLIGSVHDPIYQGAGPLGAAGIPQPKPGAVTKAHGGVLFIDEIGELHPIQMNKLLKVLEDRKVFLESAYYNPDDPNIPKHIKDVFDNGLPADFRLVGATTRLPQELSPALRSRCIEIFFRPLNQEEVAVIARNAVLKSGFQCEEGAIDVTKRFATNGREAVNIVQIAAGIAQTEGRMIVRAQEVEWVINSGQYTPRLERKVPSRPQVGLVNGLAMSGPNAGMMLEIEAKAVRLGPGQGTVTVTGVIEEEELGVMGHIRRRKSMARGAVENVVTVLREYLGDDPRNYMIHVNFPGGIPVDGPSAGISVATAIYSAIAGIPVDNKVAMTGEISIRGGVKPVGGLVAKIEAARIAGAERVLVPRENWQETFAEYTDLQVIPVETLGEVLDRALVRPREVAQPTAAQPVAAAQPTAMQPVAAARPSVVATPGMVSAPHRVSCGG